MKQLDIKINYGDIIQDNYIGFGSNNWNCDLCDEGKAYLGMQDAHFDLNAKRIATTQPAMMRISFMPYYLMFLDEPDSGEQKWNAGILNFESSYMQSFFKHAKAYKKAGTEIMINWGYAVCEKAQDWYAITGVPNSSRSAPDNLEAFAKNLRLLLEECFKRGLDNVNTVNFSNEMDYAEYSTYGDKRIYWVKMLELCHKELKAAGIRDKITIMGVDVSENKNNYESEYGLENHNTYSAEALKYIYDNAKDPQTGEKYYDFLSIHIYPRGDRVICDLEQLNKQLKNLYKYYGPMFVTESGIVDHDLLSTFNNKEWKTSNSFQISRPAQMWAHANNGMGVTLSWYYYGGCMPDPKWYTYSDETRYLYMHLWNCPSDAVRCGGVDKVTAGFGEVGLLMRYIPKHSKVLKSEVLSEDIHFTAFESNDGLDVTYVVETDKGTSKAISINLGEFSNKKFRKHIYKYPADINSEESINKYDANAVLPIGEEIIVEDGVLQDVIDEEHYLIIYTTLPEAQQVYFENPQVVQQEIRVGESIGFGKVNTVGLNGNNSVSYSIISGRGTISQDGIYTANNGVKVGDFVSVKVKSTDSSAKYEAFAVALLKIVD